MSFAEIEGREYIFVSAGASGADGNTIPHIQDAVTVGSDRFLNIVL